jgi:hypothetical protein
MSNYKEPHRAILLARILAQINPSYVQAAELLQSLKQELWPCHKTTALQLWIDVHLCHVLLRAAVASLSNTESFLVRAFQGITTCIAEPLVYSSFVGTLKVSACLGRAWMHLLKGEISEAKQDIRNNERYTLDSTALATRTTQVNWAMAASCFMAGDLGGVENFLNKVGCRFEGLADMYQIGAMDCEVVRMKGSFNQAVCLSAGLVLGDDPFNEKEIMPLALAHACDSSSSESLETSGLFLEHTWRQCK